MLQTVSYEEDRLAQYWSNFAPLKGLLGAPTFPNLDDSTKVVKVIVGQSPEKTWVIHENLFTSASQFAKSALLWPCKESEEKTIILPEEDPATFAIFVQYLYVQSVDAPSLDMVLRLYVLADKLQASTLRLKLKNALFSLHRTFTPAQLEFVLGHTALGDPLRLACIQQICKEVRSMSPFPGNVDFARMLCAKYSSEIVASLMGRYTEFILTPVAIPKTSNDETAQDSSAGSFSWKTPSEPAPARSTTTSSPSASGDSPSMFPLAMSYRRAARHRTLGSRTDRSGVHAISSQSPLSQPIFGQPLSEQVSESSTAKSIFGNAQSGTGSAAAIAPSVFRPSQSAQASASQASSAHSSANLLFGQIPSAHADAPSTPKSMHGQPQSQPSTPAFAILPLVGEPPSTRASTVDSTKSVFAQPQPQPSSTTSSTRSLFGQPQPQQGSSASTPNSTPGRPQLTQACTSNTQTSIPGPVEPNPGSAAGASAPKSIFGQTPLAGTPTPSSTPAVPTTFESSAALEPRSSAGTPTEPLSAGSGKGKRTALEEKPAGSDTSSDAPSKTDASVILADGVQRIRLIKSTDEL